MTALILAFLLQYQQPDVRAVDIAFRGKLYSVVLRSEVARHLEANTLTDAERTEVLRAFRIAAGVTGPTVISPCQPPPSSIIEGRWPANCSERRKE